MEKMFINGQWVAMSPEARTLASVNPASLENIGSFPCADQGLVNQAVEAAWGAFPGWRDLGVRGRVEKLKGLSRIIIDRSDEIARLITQEMGKPLVEAYASEIFGVVALIRYYCKKAPSLLRPRRVRYYQPLFWGKRGILELEPLGPFAVISPWNYPFGLPIGSIFPALVTGCPVIFKPSEYSTLVGIKIAELSEELNLSPGVFNLVTGDGTTGKLLVSSEVAGVSFTGSVPVGRAVAAEAGRGLKKVILELGGKDPALVLADADLNRTAKGIVWGAITNCGQACSAIERVYVDRKILSAFIEKVVEATDALRVGEGSSPDTDVGPLVSENRLNKIESQVEDARAKGANILRGGNRASGRKGFFYQPTVLVDVTDDMEVMKEETFGPVIPIMAVDSEEEMVERANRSPYGLSASIWTRNIEKGRRMARRLQAGNIWINDTFYSHAAPQCPWGGFKASGQGRTHGPWGLLEYVGTKHIGLDPGKDKGKDWWFPYSGHTLDFIQGGMALLFGTLSQRLRNLGKTIRSFYQMRT